MTNPVDTDASCVAEVERDLLIKDVAFWIEQSDMWKRRANDERDVTDRLRSAIENAPHAIECSDGNVWRDGSVLPCTCWKADALA